MINAQLKSKIQSINKKLQSNKDIQGHNTLTNLSSADNFNKWIYQSIKPWLKGRVLEIGSGIGNISSLIVEDGFPLMITEVNDTYLEILRQKFIGVNLVSDIFQINLVDPDFEQKFQHLFNSFDTVIAINVIEHIENDLIAFKNAQKFLKQEGRLIVLVPNAECLYNSLDKNLGHIRRYNKNKINNAFSKIGLIPETLFYFNFIGVVGWWVSGNLLKNKTIPKYLLNIFEFIVQYTSWMDKLFRNWFGLSIIVVGKKINRQ